MVRDRLPELRMSMNGRRKASEDVVVTIDEDNIEKDNEIDNILSEFNGIRIYIEDIRENLASMRRILSDMTTTIQHQKLSDLLEEKRQVNLAISSKIYNTMKKIEENLPFKDDLCALSRIKKYQFYYYREEFLNIWNEHENFLMSYEEKMKKLLVRQAKIMDSNLDEEELESLLENNITDIFVGNIVQQTLHEKQVLQELKQRQNELLKIEKSIMEARDMFLRISTLVMEQSDKIQKIEYFATQSTNKVEKGGTKLEKARGLKAKALKKKTCILIWLTVILALIILILIVF